MLVKDETKYCWVLDEYVGEPQDSIEDAIKDFAETYPADELPKLRVGNPYYYIPTVDAEHVIEDVIDYDLDDEIAEWSEDYLLDVKQEHIDELQKELTAVFRTWEKRHGYENTSYVVLETKQYLIGDYVKDDKY